MKRTLTVGHQPPLVIPFLAVRSTTTFSGIWYISNLFASIAHDRDVYEEVAFWIQQTIRSLPAHMVIATRDEGKFVMETMTAQTPSTSHYWQ